ncbi:unnamed protein product [Cylicostephanus goldi]|uniref:CCHC-type domain-containing protein n=1 Tax=Cylicostephanus goldi TaxID=71465 RepID=A0A3P6QU46_CYLGO|nr:unnamed protein product [Cylicostephanus goldi]
MTGEQFKCLIFVSALKDDDCIAVRTRVLKKMKIVSDTTTIDRLEDHPLIRNPKHLLCINCGARTHRTRRCDQTTHECNYCKKRGHLEKYCLRELFVDEAKDVRHVATSPPKETKACRTAYVVDGPPLFGMDWRSDRALYNMIIRCYDANTVVSMKDMLQGKFAEVFQPGLGYCTKMKASLVLKEDTNKTFRKGRSVPYAALPAVSAELERQVDIGVLSPTTHSEWAAPIVCVKKSNGKLRIYADFLTGLNDALEPHEYPSTPEDVVTKLNGGLFFTALDFSEACLQVEVDDDAKRLLVINTHKGFFHYNRLSPEVKTAPGIFKQLMDSMIADIAVIDAYIDDIVITGSSVDEHIKHLIAALRRVMDYGFRLGIEKCAFLQREIKYLGMVVVEYGRRMDTVKIRAIGKMPAPHLSQCIHFSA